MSQMLYAGQSAREIVTFLSDFQQLQRAQFMYQVHEILIHQSQPICNPFGQILWSWVVLGLIYDRSNFCHKFYSERSEISQSKIYGKSLSGHLIYGQSSVKLPVIRSFVSFIHVICFICVNCSFVSFRLLGSFRSFWSFWLSCHPSQHCH